MTRFAYASAFDHSQVTATVYGDSSTTVTDDGSTVTGTDAVFTTYDNLGRVEETTDQRGVKHAYTYDGAGRLTSDSINGTSGTVLAGMAAGIRTIAYAYDDEGRLSLVSSKNASNSVRNQVGFTYDAWGNVIRDAQAHVGVVDPVVGGSVVASPSTRYVYADGSGTGIEAKYVRLAKTLYPKNNGTTVGTYLTSYENSDVGKALVRSSGVFDGSASQQIGYAYLGANQIIRSSRPQSDGGDGALALIAGFDYDDYAGLDRYGRWANLKWADVDENHTAENRLYTYNRTGNRLSMDNANTAGASNYDETYAYDGLNRLVAWEQGRSNGSVIPNANSYRTQTWTPDTMGNWRNAVDDLDGDAGPAAATQTAARTVNGANEIVTNTATNNGSGVFPTAYDATGNITSTERTGNRALWIYFAYDGWNHEPASAKDQSATENNAFDGLGRLISKGVVDTGTSDGPLEEYYYSGQQIVEVRAGTIGGGTSVNPREQTLWDASYVNAPAVVKLDDDPSTPAVDKTLYPTWDANFNVTALVNASGVAVERYVYEPYGIQTTLNGESNYAGTGPDEGGDFGYDWSGTDYANFLIGFQGMRYDPDSGTNLTWSRRYLPGLGTFDGRDALGTAYQDGMNLYQFVRSAPTRFLDISGREAVAAGAAAAAGTGGFWTTIIGVGEVFVSVTAAGVVVVGAAVAFPAYAGYQDHIANQGRPPLTPEEWEQYKRDHPPRPLPAPYAPANPAPVQPTNPPPNDIPMIPKAPEPPPFKFQHAAAIIATMLAWLNFDLAKSMFGYKSTFSYIAEGWKDFANWLNNCLGPNSNPNTPPGPPVAPQTPTTPKHP